MQKKGSQNIYAQRITKIVPNLQYLPMKYIYIYIYNRFISGTFDEKNTLNQNNVSQAEFNMSSVLKHNKNREGQKIFSLYDQELKIKEEERVQDIANIQTNQIAEDSIGGNSPESEDPFEDKSEKSIKSEKSEKSIKSEKSEKSIKSLKSIKSTKSGELEIINESPKKRFKASEEGEEYIHRRDFEYKLNKEEGNMMLLMNENTSTAPMLHTSSKLLLRKKRKDDEAKTYENLKLINRKYFAKELQDKNDQYRNYGV